MSTVLEACRRPRHAGKRVVEPKAGAAKDAAPVAFAHTDTIACSHTDFTSTARANGPAIGQELDEVVVVTKAASVNPIRPKRGSSTTYGGRILNEGEDR